MPDDAAPRDYAVDVMAEQQVTVAAASRKRPVRWMGATAALAGSVLTGWGMATPWAHRAADYAYGTTTVIYPAAVLGPVRDLLGPINGDTTTALVVVLLTLGMVLPALLTLAVGLGSLGRGRAGPLVRWSYALICLALMEAPFYLGFMLLQVSFPFCIRVCSPSAPAIQPGYWITLGGLLLSLLGVVLLRAANQPAPSASTTGDWSIRREASTIVIVLLIVLGITLVDTLLTSA